jgi:uncharacterized protein YlxW (UPF0749 family)
MTPVSTQSLPRPADPSAALLDRIAQEALNPAYAVAHDEVERKVRSPHGKAVTALTLAVAGLLASVLLIASSQGADDVDSERASLVALADEAQAEVEALERQVGELDAQVRDLREQVLGSETIGAQQAQQIAALGISSGVAPVAGPGALVTLNDGDTSVEGTDAALSRVLDIDVQQVVNGLWEAGAEAVAVNDQRVGALTAIRSVQDVVLVNYNPVVAPYEIRAIGDPRTLPTDFLRSSGGEWLQAVSLSAGITFSIDSVDEDVTLNGEPGGSLRYATAVVDAAEDAG